MTLELRQARGGDAQTILTWRAEAAAWLRAKYEVDQWEIPFPHDVIDATINAGQVWMLEEDSKEIATITLTDTDDPRLWTSEELLQPSLYVHKLTVRPSHSGRAIGSALLDWAGKHATEVGARWLRLDAWTTNPALHHYYKREGFRHIRTVVDPQISSGALFERPATVANNQGPCIEEVSTARQPASARKQE